MKQLIVEIHRRTLWQVLAVYLGASWIVLEVADQVIARYLLPEWVYGAAFLLLLIGLPIVLATAMVREGGDRERAAARDPTLLSLEETSTGAPPAATRSGWRRQLTWPRAILGGVLAFTGLAIISGWIVLRGTARVTEAHGAASDVFEERAWIVMAEFEAPGVEPGVTLAVREALEVDLQQSTYVNVFGRNNVRPVLRRMNVPDTTALDETLALEVAEREGLAAVLSGALAHVGENYVFVARVLQPGTAEELVSVRSAASADRFVEGVEALSRELRRRLGEAPNAIRESRPLPEVTTRSLEALKKYSAAVVALEDREEPQSIELLADAISLDSSFAMAYRLASVANNNLGRVAEAARYSTLAYDRRDRLTDRERLHVEAFYHWAVNLDARRAADAYEALLSQYPDDGRAANNLGVMAGFWMGDAERAYPAFMKSVELEPYGGLQTDNAVSSALWTGRLGVADSLIDLAPSRGLEAWSFGWRLAVARVQHDWRRAEELCDALMDNEAGPVHRAQYLNDCGALHIARGRVRHAIGNFEEDIRTAAEQNRYISYANRMAPLAFAEQLHGNERAARRRLLDVLERYPASSLPEPDRYIVGIRLRVFASELGFSDLVARIESAYPQHPDTSRWLQRYANTASDAAAALGRGDAEGALGLLRDVKAMGYDPGPWSSHVLLLSALAFDATPEADSAVSYYQQFIEPRRLIAGTLSLMYLPVVERRLAELEAGRGNVEAAVQHYRNFLELWSDPDPELRGQVEAARRALFQLAGVESG